MITVNAENGVVYMRADNIKAKHGFSTRIGGESKLAHTNSLNLAFGRGDDRQTVLRNLELFSDAVGFDSKKCISVSQIHSAEVKMVTESEAGEGYFIPESFACDGYVTNVSGISIGVKSADCVPILMEGCDEFGRILAVGAVHAGWRGTVGKIGAECIKKLSAFGIRPDNIKVAIGPAICGECYSVRRDFYDTVRDILGERDTKRFLKPTATKDVWLCDLREMNKEFLILAGVRAENIEITEECTCCMPEKYFSHRYTGGVRGTMLSVIEMP